MMVLAELMFVVMVPARGELGRVRVEVENVQPRDQEFVRTLAALLEAWLNERRRRR